MPQEFHVLRCFSCHMFQVHQVKKKPKWQCKVCSEKQSVRKVYGRGSGKECRQLVQTLNVTAAAGETSAAGNSRSPWQPNPEDDFQQNQPFCLNETNLQVEESLIEWAPQQSRWEQFCDEEETDVCQDEVDAVHNSDFLTGNVTTERPTRGKRKRCGVNQHDRFGSQSKKRQKQTWYATEESSENTLQNEQQYSKWKGDADDGNLPPAGHIPQHKEAERMTDSSGCSEKGIPAHYLVSGGRTGDTYDLFVRQSYRRPENKQQLGSPSAVASQKRNHDVNEWTHDPRWMPDSFDTPGMSAVSSRTNETKSVLSKWSKYAMLESDSEESEEEKTDFPSGAEKDTTLPYSHQNAIYRDFGTVEDSCTETQRDPVCAPSTCSEERGEWYGSASEYHSSIIHSKKQHSSDWGSQRLGNHRDHMYRTSDKNRSTPVIVMEQARPLTERTSDTSAGGVLKNIQNNAKPNRHRVAPDISQKDGARCSSSGNNLIFNLPAEELEDLPDDFDDW